MSDSFIYPCLTHLMQIIESKEKNKEQEFYHTQIVINHFYQSKQLFQNNSLFYQTLLNYYQQYKLIHFNNLDSQRKINMTCVGEESKVIKPQQQSVFQIIIGIITMGVKTLIGTQISCQLHKHVIQLCEDLHQTLAFQGLSISEVLLKFIPSLTKSIKNLFFYQNLLEIFFKLDFYQIINFLQQTIKKFRDDWEQKQRQIQSNTLKARRQTNLLTSIKRNVSLQQNEKSKQNQQVRENIKSVSKIVEKPKQILQSNFKKILPSKRVPPSSNRRRTFNIDKVYKFNGRQTTSDFHSSIETTSFQVKKENSWKDVRFENYGRKHDGIKYLENQSDDVLADSTPNKKKKFHNKKI